MRKLASMLLGLVALCLVCVGCGDSNTPDTPEPTPTMVDANQLAHDLEAVEKTEVCVSGVSVVITPFVHKKVQDIHTAIQYAKEGYDLEQIAQKAGVETVFDKTELRNMLKDAVPLNEFEKFDWKRVYERIEPGSIVDLTDCIVLKYDKAVIDHYYRCKAFVGEYLSNRFGTLTTKARTIKVKDGCVKIRKNELVFDDSFIDDFLRKLEKSWDTLGRKQRVRLLSTKGDVRLPCTFGTIMDSEKEKAYLIKRFHKGKSFEYRTPYLKRDQRGKIGKTRIEVCIADQRVWVYRKGRLINSSSVVTGKDGHNTPKGIYFMSERVPGKYLVGDDYKTWVNRWMRLTDMGVGLHDANWRSAFGGTIYHSSGSHGCVNLPPSFAYWLYPKTYYGEPVIVY